ncbi:MAG TPA: hypothetical protein VF884_16125 [Nitrososphaeraceae archaeon]
MAEQCLELVPTKRNSSQDIEKLLSIGEFVTSSAIEGDENSIQILKNWKAKDRNFEES